MATKRPIKFKVRVLELYETKNLTPTESFAKACKEFKIKPSGCMTNYASGYIKDYEAIVKAKLWDGDKAVHKMCKKAGIYNA